MRPGIAHGWRRFADRVEAGRVLGAALDGRVAPDETVVLGLPRGGVPVAAEVARALGAPLDVLLVRKLGAPGQPELAIGAIAEDGVALVNEDVLQSLQLGRDAIDAAIAREQPELDRRLASYRGGRPPVPVAGRTAVVVDDGLATGATMEAAVRALAARGAGRLVVAVPVASIEAVERLRTVAHDVIAVTTPAPFYAVGAWYVDFTATDDDEVVHLLADARERSSSADTGC
jgi:putative phosphoribosyl transferase